MWNAHSFLLGWDFGLNSNASLEARHKSVSFSPRNSAILRYQVYPAYVSVTVPRWSFSAECASAMGIQGVLWYRRVHLLLQGYLYRRANA